MDGLGRKMDHSDGIRLVFRKKYVERELEELER
jgi:hypothetical protein